MNTEVDLLSLVEGTRPITTAGRAAYAAKVRALQDDLEYHIIDLRGSFISQVYESMSELSINQNELAERWGKSRQYLSHLLSESKRTNFTLETIASLMWTLGRKTELHFPKRDAASVIAPADYAPTHWLNEGINPNLPPLSSPYHSDQKQPEPSLSPNDANECAIAA